LSDQRFDCVPQKKKSKQQIRLALSHRLKQQSDQFREMTIRNDLSRNRNMMSTVFQDANFSYQGRPLRYPNQRTKRLKDLAERHRDVQSLTKRCFQTVYK
jgi:hypothetical protein